VNREVTDSSGDLYILHGVWERPPANNLPQTPHSAGAYGTGYVLFFIFRKMVIPFFFEGKTVGEIPTVSKTLYIKRW